MTEIRKETLDQFIGDAMPMLEAHYAEIAWNKPKIPLAPDLDTYRKLEEHGFLEIFAARDGEDLVGYDVWIVSKNLHYSILAARNDLFYVERSRRGAAIGQMLEEHSKAALRARGVVVMERRIKITPGSFDWSPIAHGWGYADVEKSVFQWIGE